jgi:hypothetical protein
MTVCLATGPVVPAYQGILAHRPCTGAGCRLEQESDLQSVVTSGKYQCIPETVHVRGANLQFGPRRIPDQSSTPQRLWGGWVRVAWQ